MKKIRSWPYWVKKYIGVMTSQAEHIAMLEDQLSIAKFENFCTKLQLKLSQLDQKLATFPVLLSQLEQQLSTLYGVYPKVSCVLCYPFNQECFIYHADHTHLNADDVNVLQQTLLNYTPYNQNYSESVDTLQILSYQAKLLFVGQEIMVWRLYDVRTEAQQDLSFYALLDQALEQGMTLWVEQQQKNREILLQERREVAAELHDSIAQILGFLRIKSAQLKQQCRQDKTYRELEEVTSELASYTHYAYQQTRELITASRLVYQELDFSLAIKKVIDEFEHQSGILFVLDNRVAQFKISAKESVQLLYIIRESLSNVVRHSHASMAQVSLQYISEYCLKISISDNGRGMDLNRKRSDSFGLEIMHERAERIGAVLHFDVNMPQGTCITLVLDTSQ